MRRPHFHKYGARKAHCSIGHEHASQREAKRCNELRLMERAGEISHLEAQPQFYFEINGKTLKHENGRRVGVKLDFTYRERDGRQIAEDSKGYSVRDWPLRKAIFRALFPHIELREV
jgi:hypothetical protein